MARLWTCPFCNRPCTLQDSDVKFCQGTTGLSEEYGAVTANFRFTICPNPECRQLTIDAHILEYDYETKESGKLIHKWQLIPESDSKPFPDYIPQQLRDDYTEACLIKSKRPKSFRNSLTQMYSRYNSGLLGN